MQDLAKILEPTLQVFQAGGDGACIDRHIKLGANTVFLQKFVRFSQPADGGLKLPDMFGKRNYGSIIFLKAFAPLCLRGQGIQPEYPGLCYLCFSTYDASEVLLPLLSIRYFIPTNPQGSCSPGVL